MDFKIESYRHAETILNEKTYVREWNSLKKALKAITDRSLETEFNRINAKNNTDSKSLSKALNNLIKNQLVSAGWKSEVSIFQDVDYSGRKKSGSEWRLDFAGEHVCIEVAFNHGEAIAWNLIKPVLASELNHVKKAIQASVGVVICVTSDFKKKGGFDGSVGEFEKFKRYLKPLSGILSVPIVIIGLEAPKTFTIEVQKIGKKNVGKIVKK